LFVSYQNGDCVVARQLTEQLMVEGLVPWFAEYMMPYYKNNDFKNAIDVGVKSSRQGLCLTNGRYFKSNWCQYELAQLSLPSNCTVEGLFALELEEISGVVNKTPRKASVKFESIYQAVETLGPHFGIQYSTAALSTETSAQDRRRFKGPSSSYSLNLAGWEVTPARRLDAGGGDVWGPAFRRWFDSFLIWGHLIIGPQDSRLRRRPMETGKFDDREYYEEAVKFAQLFYKNHLPQKLRGIHLLHLAGWSHPALTTFVTGTWSRMYSLVFPSQDGGSDLEYAFFFFAREPFRDFCRHAHAMDKLVLSLEVV
jgi:hypothetical protein